MSGAATTPVVGAVLVGGMSRRMGRPKALVEVDGMAMATRIGAALNAAGCASVFAVGPPEFAAGLDHIADLHPGEGPLGGILTALVAADGAPTLVVACDLPWIDPASLRLLIEESGRGEDVVAARSTHLEPLCALWQPTSKAKLQLAFDRGERAVHRAMASLAVIEVSLPVAVLANVNTPDDLPQ